MRTEAPQVTEAAVFAVPDATNNKVRCAARLAQAEIPEYAVVGDILPHTDSVEVTQYELDDAYAEIDES